MTVVTQLCFEIVEENNYMFRPFSGWAIIRLRLDYWTVCDTQFALILFFLSFFGLMFNLRGPQGQNLRTTRGPRTTVWETLC
jgi:hypothetical protein